MVWHFASIKRHNCTMSSPEYSYPNSWYVASAPILAEQPVALGELACDVCVVGGGYTGLSCALHLAKSGKSVVLLEAERVGWGASGRNGGHVGTGQRADQHSLEKWYGKTTAKELWRLGLEAVDLVTDLVEKMASTANLAGLISISQQRNLMSMSYETRSITSEQSTATIKSVAWSHPHWRNSRLGWAFTSV